MGLNQLFHKSEEAQNYILNKMKIAFAIICVVLFSTLGLSQKETGYYVEITGNNFIKNINNTKWKLQKIIKGKGLFKRIKKPKAYEDIEIYFKDGIVEYFYIKDNRKATCTYFLADLTGDAGEYMYITVDCPVYKYDWLVYRLSNKKLVIGVNERHKDDFNQILLGRYVFYRIENN
jgi:hypothetical protein